MGKFKRQSFRETTNFWEYRAPPRRAAIGNFICGRTNLYAVGWLLLESSCMARTSETASMLRCCLYTSRDGAPHASIFQGQQASDRASARSCASVQHISVWPAVLSNLLVTLSLMEAGCRPDCSTILAAPCIV